MEENDVTYVWYQSEYKSANFMTDELREELNTFGSHPLWMLFESASICSILIIKYNIQ